MPNPAPTCRHLWQPRADEHRIWRACLKCGVEQHVTTHADHTARTIAYIMGMKDED